MQHLDSTNKDFRNSLFCFVHFDTKIPKINLAKGIKSNPGFDIDANERQVLSRLYHSGLAPQGASQGPKLFLKNPKSAVPDGKALLFARMQLGHHVSGL